jgi:transposase InsO family protein
MLMSGQTAALGVGVRLELDGERWEVLEWSGREILLCGENAQRLRRVGLAWLLSQPDLRVLGEQDADAAGLSPAVVLGELDQAGRADLEARVAEVQEVLTGFRRGSAELALPGEPRDGFGPGSTAMSRYRVKAAELGVGESTVRRWVAAFVRQGPAGLVARTNPVSGPGEHVDARWIEMCRVVLAERADGSRPTRAIVLAQVGVRLAEQYGPGVVALPGKSTAYEVLRDLSRGTNAFTGSTKGKRSIAERPAPVYGRLRAVRPGEYVLLDTTRLDVFAMEPVTCRWVQAELTVAMDVFTRCITGLRLTPVSTKAVDVAGVLYETVRPRPAADDALSLAGHGVPATVLVEADKLVDAAGRRLLPSVAAETIVYDHGQIYVSEHVRSVCARLGISLQPARLRTPTDKSPVERWFRTLGEGLLAALPGYKGPDVHSRGKLVENEAFFFLDELEQIIREWIGLYHRRAHRSLRIAQVPGLRLSPLEMFEHGVHRAGWLQIPWRPDTAYDFLAVEWTSIQHYGVQVGGLRYDGPGLTGYRNQRSRYRGPHAGKWPIGVDPSDRRAVFFQDPHDHAWHRLAWEHAPLLDQPFSGEAVDYARGLAARTQRFPNVTTTLIELLERWGAGLTTSAAERRMATRISQQRLLLFDPGLPDSASDGGDDPGDSADAAEPRRQLPSQRNLTALTGDAADAVDTDDDVLPDDEPDDGDDDPNLDDEPGPDRDVAQRGESDFYADVMDSE